MGVLDGIRVLDLSVHFAGPYSTVVLNGVGAEVSAQAAMTTAAWVL